MTCMHDLRVHVAQMGGPDGVLASEVARITVAQRDGMWMHAVPRHVAA